MYIVCAFGLLFWACRLRVPRRRRSPSGFASLRAFGTRLTAALRAAHAKTLYQFTDLRVLRHLIKKYAMKNDSNKKETNIQLLCSQIDTNKMWRNIIALIFIFAILLMFYSDGDKLKVMAFLQEEISPEIRIWWNVLAWLFCVLSVWSIIHSYCHRKFIPSANKLVVVLLCCIIYVRILRRLPRICRRGKIRRV